jgi:hypothetical protein
MSQHGPGQKKRKSFAQQKKPYPSRLGGTDFGAFSGRLPPDPTNYKPGLPKSIVEFEQCHNFMIYFFLPKKRTRAV